MDDDAFLSARGVEYTNGNHLLLPDRYVCVFNFNQNISVGRHFEAV
jgi:hypothetical protein